MRTVVRAGLVGLSRAMGFFPLYPVTLRLNAWVARAGPVEREVGGVVFELDLLEHVQRQIYYAGGYEHAEARAFLSQLKPGDNVVDVGANVGYYALMAARRVAAYGTVHAFEPIASNAARIRVGAQRNGLANVRVVEAALSDAPGELLLHAPRSDNAGTYSVASVDADPAARVRVPALTLDAFRAREGLKRVDVLKIDVQGAEWAVLRGARETLGDGAPLVFCEIHPRHLAAVGRGVGDVLDLLDAWGYAPGRIRRGRFVEDAPALADGEEAMVVFRKRSGS